MTEGSWPKADGDIFYACEANGNRSTVGIVNELAYRIVKINNASGTVHSEGNVAADVFDTGNSGTNLSVDLVNTTAGFTGFDTSAKRGFAGSNIGSVALVNISTANNSTATNWSFTGSVGVSGGYFKHARFGGFSVGAHRSRVIVMRGAEVMADKTMPSRGQTDENVDFDLIDYPNGIFKAGELFTIIGSDIAGTTHVDDNVTGSNSLWEISSGNAGTDSTGDNVRWQPGIFSGGTVVFYAGSNAGSAGVLSFNGQNKPQIAFITPIGIIQSGASVSIDVSDDGGATYGVTNGSPNTPIDISSLTGSGYQFRFNFVCSTTGECTPVIKGYGVTFKKKDGVL